MPSLLRLVTCGSVDDGKSTLIGRLLFDAKGIFEDQLASVEKASGRYGTTGANIDLALLTDGLKAEREQGITIDVAYRYFSTPVRPFIIADCPGHEQYTRNMATGASTADVAILLIDARHGVVTQTRRHAFIVSLLGLRHVVLAVNKMDLVGWDRGTFERIVADFQPVRERTGLSPVHAIPMSALTGDNVTLRSERTPWYVGAPLLEHLERLDLSPLATSTTLRMPVQLVSRPNLNFRGYMGEVAAGTARAGDRVLILPTRTPATIAAVLNPDGETSEVSTGQAATITLTTEVDASRGDMIVSQTEPPRTATRLLAHLVWFSEAPMALGAPYRLKQTTRLTSATVTSIAHRIDVNTLDHLDARSLQMNDIALCEIEVARPLAFDPYGVNRATGSLILIDRLTGNTVAAGMILSEATPRTTTSGPVTARERAHRLGQRPAVVSIPGDPHAALASAHALDRQLFAAGHYSVVLEHPTPAAIQALTLAGFITIVPAPYPDAALTAKPNDPNPASSLYSRLRDKDFLSAPLADFEI